MQGVKWEDNPNLARWFKSIDERPAVKAALAKVAAIKSHRDAASEDQKDRFFPRPLRASVAFHRAPCLAYILVTSPWRGSSRAEASGG